MSLLGRMLGSGRSEHYDRGLRLFDQGLYEEAVEELKHVRRDDGDRVIQKLATFYTAEAHANLGQIALKARSWDHAEHHFRQAAGIHSQYADLHYFLATALRHQGRHDDALAELDEALATNPRFAKAHFERGVALYAVGCRDQALAALATAVEIDPGFRTVVYDAALEAHDKQNYEAALLELEQVATTEVDDIQFHLRLGEDLYRRGSFRDAAGEFRKALELNPSFADVRSRLALALSANGEAAEAVTELRRALGINPRYVEARLNLAVLLRGLGETAEAADEFRSVLEIEPDNDFARENLERLERALAA